MSTKTKRVIQEMPYKDNQWFQMIPNDEVLWFECCECGLSHEFEFDIKNRKELGIKIRGLNE